MTDLTNKTVLITGSAGFLGKHLVPLFEGKCDLILPTHEDCDLTLQNVCELVIATYRPQIVINLAANVGGIGYNKQNPASLFYDNAMIGINLIHASYKARVDKFVQIGTICAYPKITPVPFKEENLWDGYPEETNSSYGLAKKMLLVMLQAYRKQYEMNGIYLLPVNLYGPGDNFNPKSSHVIPSLIRKFIEAKEKQLKEVEIWGTGKPTREFLYVKDAAEGIYQATLNYNKPDPVNLGSGMEISIMDLAEMIKELIKFEGNIVFNPSKPDGQPRRSLDVSKAKEEFGFSAKTDFNEGLKKTIDWYLENKKSIEYYENLRSHSIN